MKATKTCIAGNLVIIRSLRLSGQEDALRCWDVFWTELKSDGEERMTAAANNILPSVKTCYSPALSLHT